MIPAVPTTTAMVKSHRNKRSRTIATNFQSSLTFFFVMLDEFFTQKRMIIVSMRKKRGKTEKKCKLVRVNLAN